jgi:hypothetical protein
MIASIPIEATVNITRFIRFTSQMTYDSENRGSSCTGFDPARVSRKILKNAVGNISLMRTSNRPATEGEVVLRHGGSALREERAWNKA